jgi:hypothetical protein
MEGGADFLGTRPFVNIDGCRPVFAERNDAFGAGLVHLMSSVETIELGTLPWSKIIHDAIGLDLVLWGPDERFDPEARIFRNFRHQGTDAVIPADERE